MASEMELVQNLTDLEGCVVDIIDAQDGSVEDLALHTDAILLAIWCAVGGSILSADRKVSADK